MRHDIRTQTLLAIARRPDGELRIAKALSSKVKPADLLRYTDDELYEALERVSIQSEGGRL